MKQFELTEEEYNQLVELRQGIDYQTLMYGKLTLDLESLEESKSQLLEKLDEIKQNLRNSHEAKVIQDVQDKHGEGGVFDLDTKLYKIQE
jgi:flagellar biosynthesis/type III secretory pathway chaperone